MKITLVRPSTFTEVFYPYNIECISSILRANGHSVSLIDMELAFKKNYAKSFNRFTNVLHLLNSNSKLKHRESAVEAFFNENTFWTNIANHILSGKPDVIGISCYSSSMSSTKKIIDILRNDFSYGGKIIIGGIHPSSAPKEVFIRLPKIDYIVLGEGEKTIIELIDALENNLDVKRVRGLCYAAGNEIIFTEPRPLIDDLSELPVNNFDFTFDTPYDAHVILTSRGCPYPCEFCASKVVFGRRVRYRPAESIGQEIVNIVNNQKIDFLRFGDDTFTLNKKHMIELHDEIKKRNINLRLSVGSRIDTIDEEKVDILKAMGVKHISFGVETGSTTMQKRIQKNINLEEVVPKIKMVNSKGLETLTFFIINHPGETSTDMRLSFELIKKLYQNCALNRVEIGSAIPYPKTPWWDYAEKNSLLNLDFYLYSHKYSHGMTPHLNMSAESLDTLSTYYKKITNFVNFQNVASIIKQRIGYSRKA